MSTGNKTISFKDGTIDVTDLRTHGRGVAARLRALGVRDGDRVALLLANEPIFFEAMFAVHFAGATPVPINWHFCADDVAFVLRDCEAKLLVAHSSLIERFADVFPDNLIVLEVARSKGSRSSEIVRPNAVRYWEAAVWDDAIEVSVSGPVRPMMYTSGTTGRPKRIKRRMTPRSPGSSRALRVYGLDGDDPKTVLINGPLYHSVPNTYGRLALEAGANLVLEEAFDPEEMLHLVTRHRVTHMHVVPSMFRQLLELPQCTRDACDCSSLSHVVHGAARCTPTVKRAMIDWWGPIVHEYYGATETGLLTFHGSDEALRKPGTVGRALDGIRLEIRDPEGRLLPPGEIGEIFAVSTATDATPQVSRDPSTTAGDIGWLDEDDYLFLVDRKTDVIRLGDRDLYPSRIEATALELRELRDCAAVADEVSGRVRLCLYVQLSDAGHLAEDEVRRHLMDRLPPDEVPERISILERLPREDSGKLFKLRLQEAHA